MQLWDTGLEQDPVPRRVEARTGRLVNGFTLMEVMVVMVEPLAKLFQAFVLRARLNQPAPATRLTADNAALTARLKLPAREGLAFGIHHAAFTLIEVMMGVLVMGIMMVSLYAGFVFGFEQVRLSRENVRATQVLEEKMEVLRLINWDQVVNYPGFIPTTFTAAFYADNTTNAPSGNFIYTGTVLVTNAPITETYASNLRMIQIRVSWLSGRVTRSRQMTTFVSQYGMQKYIW